MTDDDPTLKGQYVDKLLERIAELRTQEHEVYAKYDNDFAAAMREQALAFYTMAAEEIESIVTTREEREISRTEVQKSSYVSYP